ncbi:GAF domain-containing protein [Actinoplanes sp. N902-109]|uniref:helix-turn-helix domain-containing protein n=1 Tax=Actinoplanes sp. (strain N902-109) TaxID=649831 RepID=UPI0003295409|nr:GAF domain-containing protein [Actinoplanes sp. N902-109]AGL17521.1 GAF domain-containing protein [Actinoplanes sp. N902-109]
MSERADAGSRPSRERELASLYATARSLTALGDVADVLGSIVRHAHDLIGTDFTYLSLLGDDGTLSITASEGTISAAFRSARIPPHTGLGGKVVDTRAAHWVEHYSEGGHLRHDPGFDAVVDSEGLVALLGVPLLVRDRVIGALFAAHRSRRRFRTDEIALLSAFADHAAIALDNARLYEQSRSALAELQTAYRTIEQQMAVMQRAQAVHEALTGVVLAGGGLLKVAGELAGQMGGQVEILDRDGVPLARGGAEHPANHEPGSDEVISGVIAQARRTGRAVTAPGPDGRRHSAATVRAGDSLLGTVVWSHSEPPSDVDVRSLERATHVVGLLILTDNAVADAAERLSGELLTDLIVTGPPVSATQRARARSRGVDLDALTVVVVARADGASAAGLVRHLHPIARQEAGLAGEHLGQAVLIAAAGPAEAFAQTVHQRLRAASGGPVTVVCDRVTGHDWARAVSRAAGCTAVVRHLGARDLGTTTDRFALYALVFEADRRDELDRFLADAIGPLLDYDARRSTDLVVTLDAYFSNDGNLRRTAQSLQVHLNTLLKRLDRAADVLGHDWRAADDLPLRLAIRLECLRRAVLR